MQTILGIFIVSFTLLLSSSGFAQQILPRALSLGGKNYITTNQKNQAGNSAIVTLSDAKGSEGRGVLNLQNNLTTGRVTLGTNVFDLTLTSTQTTAVWHPARLGRNDCKTNDLTSTKALIKKAATAKALAIGNNQVPINLAILYSPAAQTYAGGQSNVLAMITNAFTRAYASYTNSGTCVRLHLVYVGPLNYTEITPGILNQDLYNIIANTNAQAIRAACGADVVTTVLNSTDPMYSGRADSMDNRTSPTM
jgi:hypothetical protein